MASRCCHRSVIQTSQIWRWWWQSNGCSSRHPGNAFALKVLVTSGLLIKKSLAAGSLLVFVGSKLVEEALGGTLIKKLLTTCGRLSLTSGFLIKKALAGCCLLEMVLFLP